MEKKDIFLHFFSIILVTNLVILYSGLEICHSGAICNVVASDTLWRDPMAGIDDKQLKAGRRQLAFWGVTADRSGGGGMPV